MNSFSITVLVATLAILPAAAQAQDASPGASGEAASSSAPIPAQEQTSAQGQLTYEQLLTNLKNTDTTAVVSAIGSVGSSAEITIVPVSILEGAATADTGSLAEAQTSAGDRLSQLRTAVHANAAIEDKLTAAGYTDNDVLDVEAGSTDKVSVYVLDKK